MTRDDLDDIGFGIGIEPFRWRRFGYVRFSYSRSRWFNIGPLFIQWSWPLFTKGKCQ